MVRPLTFTAVMAFSLPLVTAQPGPASRFMDAKVCATCHREIAAKYARTGMGRSFYKPAASYKASGTIEDFYHAISDSHYRMTIRNGDYFQRRWQIGPDGKEINVEELKID